jgi:zinc finger HIT domain-containing protein 1
MQALAEANPTNSRSTASGANNKRPSNSRRDTPSSSKPPQEENMAMADADAPTVLPESSRPSPPSHPGDNDPLLMSRVPDMPSDEELRRLLSHPPFNYGEVTGHRDNKYPVRSFCEVCGYWGRVRCMKCGTRVCALDCLEAHKEECVTRYGL